MWFKPPDVSVVLVVPVADLVVLSLRVAAGALQRQQQQQQQQQQQRGQSD
jgi:hypothetical protein